MMVVSGFKNIVFFIQTQLKRDIIQLGWNYIQMPCEDQTISRRMKHIDTFSRSEWFLWFLWFLSFYMAYCNVLLSAELETPILLPFALSAFWHGLGSINTWKWIDNKINRMKLPFQIPKLLSLPVNFCCTETSSFISLKFEARF